MLSQVGETGRINIQGLGDDYRENPFAAFGAISELTGDEDSIFGTQKKEKEPEKERESSYFTFDVDYDDEEEDYKSKKGKEILGQFTKGFSSFI